MSNPNEPVRNDRIDSDNQSVEGTRKNEQQETEKAGKKDSEVAGIVTNSNEEDTTRENTGENRDKEKEKQETSSETIKKAVTDEPVNASDASDNKDAPRPAEPETQEITSNQDTRASKQPEQADKNAKNKDTVNTTEDTEDQSVESTKETKETEEKPETKAEDQESDEENQGIGSEKNKSDSETVANENISKDKPVASQKPETEKDTTKDTPASGQFKYDLTEEEKPDYTILSGEELVKTMDHLLSTQPVQKIRHDIETLKVLFYKKHKVELDKKKKEYLETGGDPEAYSPGEDPLETRLKDNMKRFRDLKAEYNRNLEVIKQENLEKKYAIIEEIKDLVNRKESINDTFHEFRELQKRWRDIGVVPQQNLKDLWETYHHHVEKFYDYIKINKELKDLDLKKNLEAKVKLCEKAEELLLENSVVKAFNTLQKYHNQWREIGPVPREMKEDIWERFKEATSKINKKHQEYYDNLKESQKQNLEQKKALCLKAEEINNQPIEDHNEWENKSKELIELQNVWKTIGFAPKKDNNKIYQRFRSACDVFFKRKREFYSQYKQEQHDNLQLKTDLCVQAEALSESTEWKKTTDELINIQKRWKEIGPVPRKHSDQIWKRFRAACDTFFNRKAKHFSKVDDSFMENLKKKRDLIERINSFKPSNKVEENFEALKEFQREWSEIGFVPIKNKDEINHAYRDAINKRFDELKVDDSRKNILRFQTKVENLAANQKTNKLRNERDKLISKLKQLENDIILWENNIGFFAKSKNADAMIREVRGRIDRAKEEMVTIEEKIRVIDSADEDE